MRLSSVIILISLVMAAASCSGRVDKEKEVLSSLLGREIVIPDSLVCRILDTPIDYDMSDADYKIVTYIDSTGCTSCRMKLASWKEIISEYSGISDSEIAFLMVVNASEKRRDLKIIMEQFEFPYPASFDPDNKFFERNSLPENEQFHTFMLDINNEVIAAGNPADNPKVRALYRKIIMDGMTEDKNAPRLCEKPVEVLGAVKAGDIVTHQFMLRNSSSDTLTLQGLIPSCDCMTVYASNDTLYPWNTSVVTVKMAIDSVLGPFKKRVDVFYNETDAKEKLTLCGYNTNN